MPTFQSFNPAFAGQVGAAQAGPIPGLSPATQALIMHMNQSAEMARMQMADRAIDREMQFRQFNLEREDRQRREKRNFRIQAAQAVGPMMAELGKERQRIFSDPNMSPSQKAQQWQQAQSIYMPMIRMFGGDDIPQDLLNMPTPTAQEQRFIPKTRSGERTSEFLAQLEASMKNPKRVAALIRNPPPEVDRGPVVEWARGFFGEGGAGQSAIPQFVDVSTINPARGAGGAEWTPDRTNEAILRAISDQVKDEANTPLRVRATKRWPSLQAESNLPWNWFGK